MKRVLGFLLSLVVLVGLGWAGWIFYWGVPVRSMPTQPSAREDLRCPKEWRNGNAYVGSPLECTDRLRESELLRQTLGLALRNGNVLTIFHRGHRVLDLLSAEHSSPPNTCQSAVLRTVVQTRDAEGKLDPLAEILCAHGEFEEHFVVLPDGTHLASGNALASPDGHLFAVGNVNGPKLRVYEWPSGKLLADFHVDCRPVAWKDNAHFSANCGDVAKWHRAFTAIARLNGDGGWSLDGTNWAIYTFRDFDENGNYIFIPLISWRPLPHYEAHLP